MTHFFDRPWFRMLLVLVVAVGFARQIRAAEAPPQGANDPLANDPVELAIRNGVKYLYSQQKGNNWENVANRNGLGQADPDGMQWGGITSMAVYGLMAAGESSQKAEVAAALKFLDGSDVIGIYAMGMKLQSWNYIDRLLPAQKQVLKKDAILLMGGCNTDGASKGLYHYPVAADGTYDLSCSNYGVLGMWAAAQQNLEVPAGFWKMVDEAWRKQQNADGGFQYMNGGGQGGASTLPMTAAGVATLFITQEMLNVDHKECKGNIVDANIEKGLDWLSKNYGGLGNLYAMYNVERVGTASGYKYFGTVDWYKQGAEFLIKNQLPDGSWAPGGHGNNITGTVWALLFLVKGRAPVMMNKLEYAIDMHGDKGPATNWNQRPRDVANITHWAGKQLEKELNWQIVNMKVDIEDLHDAPILFMSGNQTLALTKEEKDKLRQYIEGGGMILGHADCNDPKFSASFAKLGHELFPAYEFQKLLDDDLIYSTQTKEWKSGKPLLKGLSNGARELMLLIPAGDPGLFWQIKNFDSGRTKPLAEIAANIYLYAIDQATLKGKFKGQSFIVKRDDKITPAKTVKVARLQYGGNWDPEPGGWRRLANLMHNTRRTDLQIENVKLGEGKLSKEFQVAHLTGTIKFKLAESQRAELKAFVAGGGTLIVDATGGSGDFKDAVDAELKADFGKAAVPLDVNHPLYSASGEPLNKVAYRSYAKKLLVGATNAPRLRGIDVDGRMAVLYSPEDLSVGLVGMTIDGIYGYDPNSATKLMESVIFYASGGPPPPPKVVANSKPPEGQPAPAPGTTAPKPAKPEDKKPEAPKPPAEKPAMPAGKKPIAKK